MQAQNRIARRPHSRRRQAATPAGFSVVYDERGQSRWRCTRTKFIQAYGEIRRCSYCDRKDRIKPNHVCQWRIPAADDRYLKLSDQGDNDNSVERLLDHLAVEAAKFVGASSISAAVACSEAMRSLLVAVCQDAVDFARRNPRFTGDFDELIGKINPEVMRRAIESAGDDAYQVMCGELQKYRFVNLMIDAATVLNMKVVHSCFNNPFSGLAPVPFRSVEKRNGDWCEQDYASEIETAITCLLDAGLVPVAICHDRLASQDSAIRHVLERLAENPELSLIVDVPCMNHLLHNCLMSAKKACAPLDAVIGWLSDFAKRLRKDDGVRFLGAKCPLYPETRWLYIVDTISFILRHSERVRTLRRLDWESSHHDRLQDQQYETDAEQASQIPRTVLDLYLILRPLKAASQAFECEASRLSDVLPVFQCLMDWYRELIGNRRLGDDSSYEVLNELMTQFVARIEYLLPPETWAAWTLTRAGRHFLRVLNAVSYSGPAIDIPVEFTENPVAADIRQFLVTACENDGSSGTLQEDECSNLESNNSLDNECAEFTDDQGVSTSIAYLRQQIAVRRDQSLEQKLSIDLTAYAYEKSIATVEKFMKVLCPSVEGKDALDFWLYGRRTSHEDVVLTIPDDFAMWQEAHKFEKLRALSEVALRLVSVGTSESDVERINSMHKFLVHERMTNISPENLLARLRMRALSHSTRATERSQDGDDRS